MRIHESPNTPFTIIYERFKKGRIDGANIAVCNKIMYISQLQVLLFTTTVATYITIALTESHLTSKRVGFLSIGFIGETILVCKCLYVFCIG